MYCTVANISAKITEETLRNLSSRDGVIDTALVEDLITEKSDYIDNYLRGRYALPLEDDHTILRDICVDLVRLVLYERRPGSRKTEDITRIEQRTESMLGKHQRGDIVLDIVSESRPVTFRSNTRTKVFTDDILSGYL